MAGSGLDPESVEAGASPDGGEAAAPMVPRRRWRLRAGLLFLLISVLAVGALLRLLSGPVTTGFGTGLAAGLVEEAAPAGSRATLGVIGLSLTGDLAPRLHARDVVLRVPGAASLSIDTLSVETTWATLAGGAPRFGEILADHVLVQLDASAVATTGGGATLAPGMVTAFQRILTERPVAAIDIGALTLRREGDVGRDILDRAAFTLSAPEPGNLSVSLAGAGYAGEWSVRGTAVPGPGGERRIVDVTAEGLDAVDLAPLIGLPAPVLAGPVRFEGRLGLSADTITEGHGQVSLGPFVDPRSGDPVIGAGSRLEATLRPADGTLVLFPSRIEVPGGFVTLAGEAMVQAGGAYGFSLATGLYGTGAGAERLATGQLAGEFDPASGQLTIDTMSAAGRGTRFEAAARIGRAGGQLVGGLSGVIPQMTVETLKAVWPPVVAADGRRWVDEMVMSGDIRDATIDVAATDTMDDDAVAAGARLAFRFERLVFRPYDDGPLIHEGVGRGVLEGGVFRIELDGGYADLGDGRRLDLGKGTFRIPDIVAEPPSGTVDLTMTGSAGAALALWQTLPLSGGLDLPADPAGTSGTAEASVNLALPLVRDVKASQIDYEGAIRFAGLGFADGIDGRSFRDGAIAIRLADGMADITGTALVDGVRAEIAMTRPLAGEGARSSGVRLRLTEKDRRRLGIDLDDVLSGAVSVDVETVAGADGRTVRSVEVDLGEARVVLAPLGYAKAKGKPARARFLMDERNGRITIRDFEYKADGARISGDLTLQADGRLLSANLAKVAVRPGDDLSIKVVRDGDGTLAATVRGKKFDARDLVRRSFRSKADGGPAAGGEAVRIDLAVDLVNGNGDEVLAGVNVSASLQAGRLASMSLTAQTVGSGTATLTVTPEGGGLRRVAFEAGEVGRLMRFLGLYRRVQGGRARAEGTLSPDGALRLSVDGSRLRIVEEPALARLSTLAETGAAAGLATVDIERMIADLGFDDGVLTIHDGVVRAKAAGLSLQGEVDFAREVLRLSGTYLPASAVDSLLGRIPLVGQTVFAGGRAGLVGVTFRLSGPLKDPQFSANPLSIVAPGIFRKIFELE